MFDRFYSILRSVVATALVAGPVLAQNPESTDPPNLVEPRAAESVEGKNVEGESVDEANAVPAWPSFRGPGASGLGVGTPPSHWSGEDGRNIAWKTPIPGLGHSSPVIWGSKLFITTAVAEKGDAELKVGLYGSGWSADDGGVQSWRLLALDRHTGRELWQRTVHEGEPKIQRHPKSSHASSTAATDGERVAALFGSEGLYVYDLDGELLWEKDLGVLHAGSYRTPAAQWGYGSSPIFHGGKLVVQADLFAGGFVVVFDAATGEEIWRAERDDHPSWSTPTIYSQGPRDLVMVNGYKHKAAYELASGQEVWKMSGGGDIPVPTPVVAHDLVFLTSAHGGSSPIYAIKADARGDISLEGDATSNAGVAWSVPRGGSYMQTPIVVGDELYVCRDNGVLSCYDARSGERHYQKRLASSEGFTASPVSAGDAIYFTSEMGRTHVITAGTSFERLSINELGESVMATPAIADGTIYIRGRHHLVAIRESAQNGSHDPVEPGTHATPEDDGSRK